MSAGHKGTGLGLAICQQMLEQHGGTICLPRRALQVRGGTKAFIMPFCQIALLLRGGGQPLSRF